MKIFQSILVYQDADQPASASLRIAARLAQTMEARVKVVDVRQQNHDWWKGILAAKSASLEVETTEQQDCLNALVDDLDFPPDKVQIKVLEGRPIDVLVNESLAGSHDLILKDADSDSEDLYFGSLDLRLLRLAPIAVWIADSTVPAKTRRILVAVDPHVREDEMQMNQQVIRLASILARQDSAELYVVSAWYMPMAAMEEGGDDFKRYTDAKTRVRRRAWENVEQVVNTSLLRVPPDRVLFENGLPSDMIVSAVRDIQPDLLVMGTVVHRGVPGLWIGNTAEEVSRQVQCSVLAIKPKDFTFLLPSQSRVR
jgi:nucleotide-binding universal stress UspA family protein